jgi:hypothetical protein
VETGDLRSSLSLELDIVQGNIFMLLFVTPFEGMDKIWKQHKIIEPTTGIDLQFFNLVHSTGSVIQTMLLTMYRYS